MDTSYQLAINGRCEEVCAAVRADPELIKKPQRGGLYDFRTLLHCAAGKGHEGLTRALLELGADPSTTDKRGQTASALAQKQGHAIVAALLNTLPKQGGEEQCGTHIERRDVPTVVPPRLSALDPNAACFVPDLRLLMPTTGAATTSPNASIAAAPAATKSTALEAATQSAATPPVTSGATQSAVAPVTSGAEGAAKHAGTEVTVRVHCRPSEFGTVTASTAIPALYSYTSHDAEAEPLSAALETVRHRNGLLRISDPCSSVGGAIDPSLNLFAVWLDHGDSDDGAFDTDLHIWCAAVWPPAADTGDEPSSIYGILTEAADDFNDSD